MWFHQTWQNWSTFSKKNDNIHFAVRIVMRDFYVPDNPYLNDAVFCEYNSILKFECAKEFSEINSPVNN